MIFFSACLGKGTSEKQTLYVIHARNGVFQSDPNSPLKKGELALFNPDSEVLYFDSKPMKMIGSIELESFVKKWQEMFSTAPNAGFVFYHNIHQSFEEFAIELDQPRIDPIDGSVKFTVIALNKNFSLDRVEMDQVTLFIDEVKK